MPMRLCIRSMSPSIESLGIFVDEIGTCVDPNGRNKASTCVVWARMRGKDNSSLHEQFDDRKVEVVVYTCVLYIRFCTH